MAISPLPHRAGLPANAITLTRPDAIDGTVPSRWPHALMRDASRAEYSALVSLDRIEAGH